MKILLITEQRDAQWNKVSFETLAAAQQIVQQTKGTLTGVVIGKGITAAGRRTSRLPTRRSPSRRTRPARKIHARRLRAGPPPGNRIRKTRPGPAPAHLPGPRLRAQASRLDEQRHDRRLHRLPLRKQQTHLRPPNVPRPHRRRRRLRRRPALDRLLPIQRFPRRPGREARVRQSAR